MRSRLPWTMDRGTLQRLSRSNSAVQRHPDAPTQAVASAPYAFRQPIQCSDGNDAVVFRITRCLLTVRTRDRNTDHPCECGHHWSAAATHDDMCVSQESPYAVP